MFSAPLWPWPVTVNPMTDLTRRNVLIAGSSLAAVPVLAACGASGSSTPAPSQASGTLGPVSDVPVGGGHIYTDAQVVVTQPTSGVFKAFTAVCTHEGCIVSSVDQSLIKCGCHFSEFSITDGSVVQGPATKPLSTVNVSVANGNLELS